MTSDGPPTNQPTRQRRRRFPPDSPPARREHRTWRCNAARRPSTFAEPRGTRTSKSRSLSVVAVGIPVASSKPTLPVGPHGSPVPSTSGRTACNVDIAARSRPRGHVREVLRFHDLADLVEGHLRGVALGSARSTHTDGDQSRRCRRPADDNPRCGAEDATDPGRRIAGSTCGPPAVAAGRVAVARPRQLPRMPLLGKQIADRTRSMAGRDGGVGVQPIGQVDGSAAGPLDGVGDRSAHRLDVIARWVIGVVDLQQRVAEPELRPVFDVIAHRQDGLGEFVEFVDRAQGDAGGGGLVHGVDLDSLVIEGKDLVGLKTVRKQPPEARFRRRGRRWGVRRRARRDTRRR